VASANRRSRPLLRPIAAVVLTLATVPAITAGLASEAYWFAFRAEPARLPALAQAMPLVALPLAALLLILAGAGVVGRARRVRSLQAQADRIGGRLEAVVASSDDAIILLGLDGSIQSWTPAAAELYGMSGDTARAQTFDSLVEAGDLVQARQMFGRVVGGGERERGRATHRRPDGGSFIASASWSAVHDSQGAITGVSLTVRDATAETLAP